MSSRENQLLRKISIRWLRCPVLWMPANLSFLSNELLNKMAMVACMEFRHKLYNIDFHQGQSGYSNCWAPNLLTARVHQAPLLESFLSGNWLQAQYKMKRNHLDPQHFTGRKQTGETTHLRICATFHEKGRKAQRVGPRAQKAEPSRAQKP